MEVVGDWPTARYTVICNAASRGSDSFSVQRMACTLQYVDYFSIRLVAEKTCQFLFCFYSGLNVHTVILQRNALDPFKTYSETQASKRCAATFVYSLHGSRVE